MDGASDQGIVFTAIQSPATITLSGNVLDMNNATPITGQGIAFPNLIEIVRLAGNVSNTVAINGSTATGNGVTTSDWVILPLNASTRVGQFFVNGFVVQ